MNFKDQEVNLLEKEEWFVSISICMATDLTCTCTVLSAPAQVWPLDLQPHQGSERQTARTACILLCPQTSRYQMLKSRFPTPFPLETQNILGIRYLYPFILVYGGDWGKLSQSSEHGVIFSQSLYRHTP